MSRNHTEDDLIRAEQTRLLYAAMPTAIGIATAVAIALVAAQWTIVSTAVLVGWLGVHLLVSICRLWLVRNYRRSEPAPSSHRSWLIYFLIGVLCAGSLWGAAGVVLFPLDAPLHQAGLLVAIAGIGAGSVTSLSAVRGMAAAFVIPLTVPLALQYIVVEPVLSLPVSVMLLLFVIGILLMSNHLTAIIVDNLRLRNRVSARESRIRRLVESTRAILWEGDPQTFQFSFVSREAEMLLGYPVGQWISEPSFWVEHMHPEDRTWAPDYCARATEERRQHTFDYRMMAADGRVVWLRDVVSVLIENETPVKLVGVMIDITETKENEQALEYVSGLQRSLVEVSRQFIDSAPERLDSAIENALGRVGSFCGVDRGYLFRFRDQLRFSDNTHEWCAPGIQPQIDHLQNVPRDEIPNISKAMERHKIVHIPRVADLEQNWMPEKTHLQQQGIESLVVVPIVVGDELHGFIGFDSVTCERSWGDDEIRLFQVLADLIGATIQRDTAEKALRESELLRGHAESLAHLGSWEWDVANDTFLASSEWRRVTGCQDESLSHDRVLELSHPEDLAVIRAKLEQTLHAGRPYDIEHRIVRPDSGETRWVKVHAEMAHNNGSPKKMHGFVQDITERKEIEEAIAESEARYRAVVENISEVVYQTDEHGLYTFLNPAWEGITGFVIEETLNTHFLNYIHPEDVEYCRAEYGCLVHGEKNANRVEVRCVTGLEQARWIEVNSQRITDADGRFKGCTGTLRDVTEQREAEQQIHYLAKYDALTDLPNRTLALDRLDQLVNALPRSSGLVAVLYLDLDYFKKINDTLGHEVGDQVLLETAKRLRGNLRKYDTIARLGGDEFLILLSNLQDAGSVQPVVESLLACFHKPFTVSKREVALTASIGIAIAPTDGQSGAELVRNADLAMYQSKSAGRNACHYFTEAMNQDVLRRTAIEEQLRDALERRELKVVYQPVVDLQEYSIVGAEALLRWHNADLGEVNVDELIPIAEQAGLIHPIGDYVLTQALQQAAFWRTEYRSDFRISVNVSPQQLRDGRLIDRVKQILDQEGLPGEALEVEITEEVLLSDQKGSNESLYALRELGVGIAMDDFGTGYASLSYLRQYSFDTLKIDRSFVRDMTSDRNDLQLVVTSLHLANGLGLTAVAEGVENVAQLELLKKYECRLAQGYFFSPPVDSEEFSALLPLWTIREDIGC